MSNFLYELGCAAVRLYASVALQLDICWHEDPPAGAKLFIANHPSGTDPFLIHLLSPMSVLITANAFAFPLFGAYLLKTGQIPVFSGKGEQALEEACRLLEAGRSVGIFPEGTYSPRDGSVLEPRTGAARLALQTGAPIVPVGIYLARENSVRLSLRLKDKSMGGYWYFYGPYAITVGKPAYFHGDPDNKKDLQTAAQKMMELSHALARESEARIQKPAMAKANTPTEPAF